MKEKDHDCCDLMVMELEICLDYVVMDVLVVMVLWMERVMDVLVVMVLWMERVMKDDQIVVV